MNRRKFLKLSSTVGVLGVGSLPVRSTDKYRSLDDSDLSWVEKDENVKFADIGPEQRGIHKINGTLYVVGEKYDGNTQRKIWEVGPHGDVVNTVDMENITRSGTDSNIDANRNDGEFIYSTESVDNDGSYIHKHDINGNHQWTVTISSQSDWRIFAIGVDTSNGIVVVGERESYQIQITIKAIDVSTGNVIWSKNTNRGGVVMTRVRDGTVYLSHAGKVGGSFPNSSQTGRIVARDINDGSITNTWDPFGFGGEYGNYLIGMLIGSELIYSVRGSEKTGGYNVDTGQKIWERGFDHPLGGAFRISGDQVLIRKFSGWIVRDTSEDTVTSLDEGDITNVLFEDGLGDNRPDYYVTSDEKTRYFSQMTKGLVDIPSDITYTDADITVELTGPVDRTYDASSGPRFSEDLPDGDYTATATSSQDNLLKDEVKFTVENGDPQTEPIFYMYEVTDDILYNQQNPKRNRMVGTDNGSTRVQ